MSSQQLTNSPLAAEDFFWRDRESVTHLVDSLGGLRDRYGIRLPRTQRKVMSHELTAFPRFSRETHPTD